MFERLPDDADEAANFESMFRDKSVLKIQELVKPQTHPDFDGKDCLECSDPMPAARLLAGRIRCTRCETIVEKRNKLRR